MQTSSFDVSYWIMPAAYPGFPHLPPILWVMGDICGDTLVIWGIADNMFVIIPLPEVGRI
jgi:hypothetical protein